MSAVASIPQRGDAVLTNLQPVGGPSIVHDDRMGR
jgi:hypothetical protein